MASRKQIRSFNRRSTAEARSGYVPPIPSKDCFLECHERCALIHDFEIALSANSEDVEAGLSEGKFGMATETGLFSNQSPAPQLFLELVMERLRKFLASRKLAGKNARASVLHNAYQHRIPVTIHLAIGTDIPHMHPAADGARLVRPPTTISIVLRLVKKCILAAISKLGSAVLPPNFSKGVSVVRISACRCGPSPPQTLILSSTIARCRMSSNGRLRRWPKAVPRIRKATPSPDTTTASAPGRRPRWFPAGRKPHPKGSQDCGQKESGVQI